MPPDRLAGIGRSIHDVYVWPEPPIKTVLVLMTQRQPERLHPLLHFVQILLCQYKVGGRSQCLIEQLFGGCLIA